MKKDRAPGRFLLRRHPSGRLEFELDFTGWQALVMAALSVSILISIAILKGVGQP